jgi:hypothetical protein
MKTLEKKSVQSDTLVIDGPSLVRLKKLSSIKKLSVRPRKSFTRVKSLRPLKVAAGKGHDLETATLD